jgi:hypothetical protein
MFQCKERFFRQAQKSQGLKSMLGKYSNERNKNQSHKNITIANLSQTITKMGKSINKPLRLMKIYQ